MNKDIISINIDIIDSGTTIKLDRTSTDLAIVLHGLIAGAVKSLYNSQASKMIANLLAVNAGLKKDVRICKKDFPFVAVADDIYNGVREFYGWDAKDEARLCCRYIYDELQIPSAGTVYDEDSNLNID